MALLNGKRLLITGVLTDDSLAFNAAKLALEQGAEVVLTGAGRGLGLTERVARKLPSTPEVLELDVTVPEHVAAVHDRLEERWGGLDGALHAIGFAPQSCLGGGFMSAPWDDVSLAFQISTYSLKVLGDVVVPLMEKAGGGSIVGLDFDNGTQAYPAYDWMGVAKAALQSTARYMARDLGPKAIRVNLVAAGPIRTMAAKSIPAFAQFEEVWGTRAPLGWDIRGDNEAVGKAVVALFSDWFPKTTGEVIHVDGGFHAVGA
jgi:enoyl-[acyl-carrier protein] reductase I